MRKRGVYSGSGCIIYNLCIYIYIIYITYIWYVNIYNVYVMIIYNNG